MALFTVENLVLLTWAHFLIFFAPAAGIGAWMLSERGRRRKGTRIDDVAVGMTYHRPGKRAA